MKVPYHQFSPKVPLSDGQRRYSGGAASAEEGLCGRLALSSCVLIPQSANTYIYISACCSCRMIYLSTANF